MSMCDALQERFETRLIAKQTTSTLSIDELYESYHVKSRFQVALIRTKKLPGFYLLNVLWEVFLFKPKYIYGRYFLGLLFLSIFGYHVFYENHLPINYGSAFQTFLFRYLAKKSSRFHLIVITHQLKNYYQTKFGIDNIEVLPDAAFPNSCEQKIPLSESIIHIGYIGSLHKGKGMELLDEIIEECKNQTFHFHVIGGSPEQVAEWKKKLSRQPITFYGYRPVKDLDCYRKSFDVLIAPYSQRVRISGGKDASQWMSPLKIFEYMAAKVPIISTDLAVLREVLEHKRNAWLCSVDRIEEWLAGIKAIAKTDVGKNLADHAYKDFVNNYTWEIRADRVYTILTRS
jgi:glycosyltransferase involved in cell wall biosynthesis